MLRENLCAFFNFFGTVSVIMEFQKSKNRILLYDGVRAFHLCTVVGTKDGSVIITPSEKVGINRKKIIEMQNGEPVFTKTEEMWVSKRAFHATYHQKTGFKHIRENKEQDTQGEVLITFNTDADPNFTNVNFFESFLRIFPAQPSTYPFVEKIKPTDLVIDIEKFNHKPISFLFAITNARDEAIQIKAPEGTLVLPIRLDRKTVLVTAFFLQERGKFVEEWPAQTIWTTPY